MEANNYFGFTHNNNQYRTAAAAAFQAARTAYPPPVAAAVPSAATYAAQRATAAYEAAATAFQSSAAAVAAANTGYPPQSASGVPPAAVVTVAAAGYDYTTAYQRLPTAAYSTEAAVGGVKAPTGSYYAQQSQQPAAAAFQSASELGYQVSKTTADYSTVTYPVVTAVAASRAKSYNSAYPPPSVSAGSTTAPQTYQYAALAEQSAVTAAAKGYAGYDSNVYNAVTLLAHQHHHHQQQSQQQHSTAGDSGVKTGRYMWRTSRAGLGSGGNSGRVRTTSTITTRAPQQLHYCDVCRVSCAGPQTYREHVAGQKHKKKTALLEKQSGVSAANLSRTGNSLRCELCDVTCTGSDAYAAHVRGTKHVKVLKLHTKLGKPIPSENPVLITPRSLSKMISSNTTSAPSTSETTSTNTSIISKATAATVADQPKQSTSCVASSATNRSSVKNRVSFVGGGRLCTAVSTTTASPHTSSTTTASPQAASTTTASPQAASTTTASPQAASTTMTSHAASTTSTNISTATASHTSTVNPVVTTVAVSETVAPQKPSSSKPCSADTVTTETSPSSNAATASAIRDELQAMAAAVLGEKEVDPVGHEYIEVINDDEGKLVTFNCKLCDCRFNDPNAKEMHMKGRRHRLQYKRKVNPQLVVEVKPGTRQRKQLDRQRRQQQRRRGKQKNTGGASGSAAVAAEESHSTAASSTAAAADQDDGSEAESGGLVADRAAFSGGGHREQRRRMLMEEIDWFSHRPGPPQPPPPPHIRSLPHPPRSLMRPPVPFGPLPPRLSGVVSMMARRVDSLDDRCVMNKHTAIYPSDAELAHNQKVVSNVEKALKLASDDIAAADAVLAKQGGDSAAVDTGLKADIKDDKKDGATTSNRALKGVMRVGILAKGLLVRGDSELSLVVLCSQCPSVSLLHRLATTLPPRLAEVAADSMSFSLSECVSTASIRLTTTGWTESNAANSADADDPSSSSAPTLVVTITLTSPLMRNMQPPSSVTPNPHISSSSVHHGGDVITTSTTSSSSSSSPSSSSSSLSDILDIGSCQLALAKLRRSKWFQARASVLQSCVVIVRVIRDLCHRDVNWAPLDCWCLELLVERVLVSAGRPLSPGEALRCVFEAISSGLLFSVGGGTLCSPGLLDPCEKDPTDAVLTSGMTRRQCESVTAAGQRALRLMAFRQLHTVLDMKRPPTGSAAAGSMTGKRRRCNSSTTAAAGGDDSAVMKTVDAEDTQQAPVDKTGLAEMDSADQCHSADNDVVSVKKIKLEKPEQTHN